MKYLANCCLFSERKEPRRKKKRPRLSRIAKVHLGECSLRRDEEKKSLNRKGEIDRREVIESDLLAPASILRQNNYDVSKAKMKIRELKQTPPLAFLSIFTHWFCTAVYTCIYSNL
ncbi:hypothetical protein CEXT_273851 [Caerostris extrusa]|uniref:Uncharacterized protein n=1 Tax=Caerostris extrusa TaxID=172846 RepID=A0AAV4NR67_CAEEX|nr:hypothetical protein CEXT_273851 [Caerostris extrusa]